MSNAFARRKQEILQQLSVSDSDYTDLSPKGSVDEGIRELVSKINQVEGFVTTSSCAGRVAVFLEGNAKPAAESQTLSPKDVNSTSAGGKGGGSWLYVSHDPIDPAAVKTPEKLSSLLGLQASSTPSCPPLEQSTRFVHFKFEPMILHILTSSLQHAQRAHSAAIAAGFRESGIGGVVPTGVRESDCTPLVAVRTTGLAFDSIIAYEDESGGMQPMVTAEYLRVLVRIANDRFEVNAERTERFAKVLLRTSKPDDGWEPADVRRARKRAEGLRRREEMKQGNNGGKGHPIIEDVDCNDTLELIGSDPI